MEEEEEKEEKADTSADSFVGKERTKNDIDAGVNDPMSNVR